MARFLPHQGLPLISEDGHTHWTPRLLVYMAIFMAWRVKRFLKDRFNEARTALTGIYSSRKRPRPNRHRVRQGPGLERRSAPYPAA